MEIKDYPNKDSVVGADLLLIQDSIDFAYKSTTKAKFLAGLNSTNSDDSAQVDLISTMPNLVASWSAEDIIVTNNLVFLNK